MTRDTLLQILKKRDILVSLSVLLFWILVWLMIPVYVPGRQEQSVFPRIITILGFLFSLYLLVGYLRREFMLLAREDQEETPSIMEEIGGAGVKKVLYIIVLWGAYIFLLEKIGYYLMGFITLIITMLLMGVQNKKKILVISLLTIASIYLVFRMGFRLRLPMGDLFDFLL